MFENSHKKCIYLYDLSVEAYTRKFEDIDDVINYLVISFGYHNYWNKPKFDFDDINMTGNDLVRSLDWQSFEESYRLRRYMFIDSYCRTIDVRVYAEEVKKRYAEKELARIKREKEREEEWNNLKHGDKLVKGNFWSKHEDVYRFRQDPVPGIHSRCRYSKYLRHVRTTAELRANADTEYEKYVRPKRKHLPTLYDDIPRGNQKSWKKQSKKRKQWM